MIIRLARGRLTFKLYVFFIIVVIVSTIAYLFPLIDLASPGYVIPTQHSHLRTKRLSKLVTVVFRQFEEFENDVADSVHSFITAFPHMPVVVVSDSLPYPPFSFSAPNETLQNVKVLPLELRLNASPRELRPLNYINTEFTLFVPDSIRVVRRALQLAAAIVLAYPSNATNLIAIAIGVGNSHLICQKIKWHYEEWTLQYNKEDNGNLCDAVNGPHALFIKTSLLHTLPQPFVLPFPEALYLQTSAKHIKVQILNGGKFGAGRSMLKSPVAKQRAIRRYRENRIGLYKQLGVKTLIREDRKIQWFGCKQNTQRCFPSVQGTPSYILAGRNTPPCCRRNLRRTAWHVLHALLQAGARCWLETTSLLGAVTRNDVLPWAEYAEIGIHAADVVRVTWLQRGGPDPDGFVWERATKGHYYRVAFSATNRVYVLVLPFTAKNGTMSPADWVLANQKQFPERHLHPLAQIQFVGRPAPAPNDASVFLDLKLGHLAVERSEKIGPVLLYPHTRPKRRNQEQKKHKNTPS